MSHGPSTDSLKAGHLISNRYVLEKRLGTGGMGSVYLASDSVLENTKVAIKILHGDVVTDENQTKRFLREVQLMRTVNHVNVVRTYDVGVDGNLLYYTMEYVEGTSLSSLINEGSMDYPEIAEILDQTCRGLQAIHEQDIIHRDLKPANIMILDGSLVKITDFGVARSKGSDLTQHDEIIGSVSYIAPEIWLGKELTRSADLYSMGIILYEMITGSLPFEDDEPATMMWYHVKHPPSPPKQTRTSCPNWLNQLALKLMAKAPGERPKSASEISALIEKRRRAGSLRPGDSVGGTVVNAPSVSGGTGKTSGSVRVRNSRGSSRTGAYTSSHRRSQPTGFGKVFFSMCFLSAVGIIGGAFYVTTYVKSLLLL